MIPLRDVIPSRTKPGVTIALIVMNVAIFLFQSSLSERGQQAFLYAFGMVPAYFTFISVLTSMFVHGGLAHLIGNLLFLWIFGDNVEDRLGHGRFLTFYLLCGFIAAMSQLLLDPDSTVPMVGASGAIAGVMGAYFLLYPQSRILTVVFLIVFLDIVEIPAVFLLGVWFLLQVAHGALSSGAPGGGVAFWAHAGGFAVGALVGIYMKVRGSANREYWTRGR